MTKRRVRIIPYKDKDLLDNVSVVDRPKSRGRNNHTTSSIRAHSMGPTSDNPFAMTTKEEIKCKLIENENTVLRTEVEELYGVTLPKVPIEAVIQKIKAETEELQKAINSAESSNKVVRVYKRPARIYHKKNNKPIVQEEFEYNW
eukprot:TRINITY_DN7790_c0_g1_i17.p2 TRINITY_DN7790_c0_g1~~TRINITY_DN7790_c0_g1_i17.p2  ORF type:complete len:145 (+),score=22.49 TRINITY_DN7790_c0_g1_i17:602-1036(+)